VGGGHGFGGPTEGPKTATRGVLNGSLKFLSKYLHAVPKSTPKRHTTKVYQNTSHMVSREPRKVPKITRNPTQKTKLEMEHGRVNGPNNTKQGMMDCLVQYPRLSVVQKSENRSDRTDSVRWQKMNAGQSGTKRQTVRGSNQ